MAPANVRSTYGDITKAAAGQRKTVLASIDEGRDGEPSTGGFPSEDDVRRVRIAAQERFVGRQRIVDRGRIRMLGREPVIDRDDLGAGPLTDLRGQVGSEERVSQHVHATVEVHDDMAGFDPVDRDLGRSDAAECAFGHVHIGGQRLC